MSTLSLYRHSALPPASRIELQCIFVEALLVGRVGFRVDHVSPALICELAPNCAALCLDFAPLRTAIRLGEKDERHSWSIDCVVACLDHEYQPWPPALRASDAGEMDAGVKMRPGEEGRMFRPLVFFPSGALTFMVKVKAHQGETLNERADTQAERARQLQPECRQPAS